MTNFSARIESNGPERRELSQALLAWATAARREEGALGSEVYEDMESPGVFYLTSRWSSLQSWERHLCGQKFGVMLGALELLARPVQVVVTEQANESGQVALQKIRRLRDRVRRAGSNNQPVRHDSH